MATETIPAIAGDIAERAVETALSVGREVGGVIDEILRDLESGHKELLMNALDIAEARVPEGWSLTIPEGTTLRGLQVIFAREYILSLAYGRLKLGVNPAGITMGADSPIR